MARPWRHPKTGVYWFHKVVPADLRPILGKREIKISLRTKNPAEAQLQHAIAAVDCAKLPASLGHLRAVHGFPGERSPADNIRSHRSSLYWRARNDDEGHRWLRGFIISVVEELDALLIDAWPRTVTPT